MKKSPENKQGQDKPRRLVLSRETIQRLETELLATARGGNVGNEPTTTWNTFCVC